MFPSKAVENIETHFIFDYFLENRAVFMVMGKNFI